MPPNSRDVHVHIGAPKSGTTFIQDTLWSHRDTLAADGVLYPYRTRTEHFQAMLDLRDRGWGGIKRAQVAGTWDRVAARSRDWDGHNVLLTNELLGRANEQQIERVVESLAPDRVRVIYTARDLARQLVSSWQEQIKHNLSVSLEEFLTVMLEHGPDTNPPYARQFWPLQDISHVLCRWAKVVGHDRVLLVTVPPPGAAGGALWRRFCEAVGLDATEYPPVDRASNVSLSATEAEFFRRVNEGINDMSPRDYTVLVRQFLMQNTGAGRGARPTLPPVYFDRILQRAQDQVEALEQDDFPVLGNLRELLPDPVDYTSEAATTAADVSQEQLISIAVHSIHALLRSAADQRAQIHALSQELVETRNASLLQGSVRRLRDIERRLRARRARRGSRTG